MARIRTIKPEFWSSAQVMECSPIARLMFVGMWNFADDAGRMPLSPKTIKAQVFPCDTLPLETITGMVEELAANDLVRHYTVDGKEFLQITGWYHQRIDKPQPAKCPPPPKEPSGNARRTLPPDLKGREGKGEEGKGSSVPSERPSDDGAGQVDVKVNNADTPPPAAKTPDAELFVRGREVLGKNCGGLISDLKKHHGGNIALARATIEQASTKADPREYIGAVIRGAKQENRSDLVAGLWDKGL